MTVIVDEGKKTRAQQVLDEMVRAENKQTHEISNACLKGYRDHRRVHRGEKFADVGKDTASDGKTIKKRKRCLQDERLHKALGEERVQAMGLICSAFMMITAGLGMKVFNPFKTPGDGDGDIDRGARLMALYWIWSGDVQKRKLDHSACIDVAVSGRTPHEIDMRRSQRNGAAQENLIACLDIAIEMGILKIRQRED